MREILIQEDVSLVEERLKKFESATGCDLLLIVAKESDPYPAAPLRFGLITTFFVMLSFSYYLDFQHNYLWPLFFLISTLVFTWLGNISYFKKFALSSWEIKRETLEKAVEQFHVLGTSKSSHKLTAMIMVSILEKTIHVLVDEKLKTELTQEELDELVTIMQKHFKDGQMAMGFINSIASLEEKILKDFGGKVSNSTSELQDKIIFI